MCRRYLVVAAVVLGTVAGGFAADINTNGNLGVGRTLSARPMKNFKLNVQFGVNYAQQGDWVAGPVDYSSRTLFSDIPYADTTFPADGVPDTATREVVDAARMLSGNFSVAIGLAKIWDLALSLPLYYDWLGVGDRASGGIGDPEITTKISAPPAGKVWYNALHLGVTIPVGTSEGFMPSMPGYERPDTILVAENFHTWDGATMKAAWLTSLDFSTGKGNVPFAMHLNAGVRLPLDGSGRYVGLAGFALEWTPAPAVTIFIDCSVEKRLDQLEAESFFRDPIYLTPGIRINTPGGVYLSLAFDACMSAREPMDRQVWQTADGTYRYSTTAGSRFGAQVTIGWRGFLNTQDADKDGIPDAEDQCPNDPEDIDGFEDSDGCPDPDNDKDGLCDPWVAAQGLSEKYAAICKGSDKCPDVAEDFDGFEDEDGCLDADNDKDGIADEKDQCPNEPEDFDGFEDKDGCPDPDNDKDGVPDSKDRCPNDPEDIDGFEDDDGCPDIDNDKDGIPDLKDKCPNEPETFNEIDDDDGCPDEKKKESMMPRSQILRGVGFASGSAVLIPQSYIVLDAMAKELTEFVEIEIEIRGHTDATGKPETNIRLSQQRAEAVMQYFSMKGVDARRMRAVGYGAGSPIADNRTAVGRAENRRLEVVRLK